MLTEMFKAAFDLFARSHQAPDTQFAQLHKDTIQQVQLEVRDRCGVELTTSEAISVREMLGYSDDCLATVSEVDLNLIVNHVVREG